MVLLRDRVSKLRVPRELIRMMDGWERAIKVTKMIKSSRSTLTEEIFLAEAGSEQFS